MSVTIYLVVERKVIPGLLDGIVAIHAAFTSPADAYAYIARTPGGPLVVKPIDIASTGLPVRP